MLSCHSRCCCRVSGAAFCGSKSSSPREPVLLPLLPTLLLEKSIGDSATPPPSAHSVESSPSLSLLPAAAPELSALGYSLSASSASTGSASSLSSANSSSGLLSVICRSSASSSSCDNCNKRIACCS